MAAKPVVPRELARRDVDEAIAWYLHEAGAETALAFVAALEKAYAAIAERPATGSSRYAHELDLPDLRHRKLARFPFARLQNSCKRCCRGLAASKLLYA